MHYVIGKSSLLHRNQWGVLPHESILRSDQGLLGSSPGSGQVLLTLLSQNVSSLWAPKKAFIFCLSHPTKLSASVWDGCVLDEGCCGLLVSLFPLCLIEILGARSEVCSHQVNGLAKLTCAMGCC